MTAYWKVLEIAPTRDRREIKKAYARLLKKYSPEDDPDAFQRLRKAYEAVMDDLADRRNFRVPRSSPRPYPNDTEDRDRASSSPQTETSSPDNDSSHDNDFGFESEAYEGFKTADNATLSMHYQEEAETQLNDLLDYLSANGPSETIDRFHSIMASDYMLNIERRDTFEVTLILFLADPDSLFFPIEIIDAVCRYFRWQEEQFHLKKHEEALKYVQGRLEAHAFYCRMSEKAARKTPWYKPSRDKTLRETEKIDRILLGPYNPGKFKWLARRRKLLQGIRARLRFIETHHSLLFQNELDTPTIAWWRNRASKVQLDFSHIIWGTVFGSFAGFMVPTLLPVHLFSNGIGPHLLTGSVLLFSVLTILLLPLLESGSILLWNKTGEVIAYLNDSIPVEHWRRNPRVRNALWPLIIITGAPFGLISEPLGWFFSVISILLTIFLLGPLVFIQLFTIGLIGAGALKTNYAALIWTISVAYALLCKLSDLSIRFLSDRFSMFLDQHPGVRVLIFIAVLAGYLLILKHFST